MTFIITQKSAEKLNISEIANQIYTGKKLSRMLLLQIQKDEVHDENI